MMKNNILFCACLLLLPFGWSHAETKQPEWQSQYAIGLNKLKPHAYVWPYKNGDIDGIREQNYEQSPYYLEI